MAAGLVLSGCGRKEQQDKAQKLETEPMAVKRVPTADSTWKIAFNSNRDGNFEVYIMNPDGSDLVNLTQNDAADWIFYADTTLVFASNRAGYYPEANFDLYTMDRNGENLRQLTKFPVYESSLSASPDGKSYAVCSEKDGDLEIYLIDSTGNETSRLTDSPFGESDPNWSPDGRQIAYRSNRAGPWAIWVMDADGANGTRITDYPEDQESRDYQGEGPPHWSPDGSKILFFSMRDGDWDIYTIRPDGSELTNLTQTETNETWPSWSPDGRKIAFCSDRLGNYDIYVMKADGADPQKLTSHNDADQGPIWVW